MNVNKQEILAKCLGEFMHSINEVSNGTQTIPAAIYRAMEEYANATNKATSMSKREHVAAMALQALITTDKTKAWSAEEKVKEAVGYADMLFKYLEK